MQKRPAVKLVIPYLAGILLADRFYFSPFYLFIIAIILIIFALITYKKRFHATSSFIIVLLFLTIGFIRYSVDMDSPKGLDDILNQQVNVKGTVLECKEELSGGSSIILSGEAVNISKPSISMKGKISIRSWDYIFPYTYGDVLEIKGEITQPKQARNPGEFDYQKYLKRRGIFATMTVYDKSDIWKIGEGRNHFLRRVRNFRQKIQLIIDEIMPRDRPAILNDVPINWKVYDSVLSKSLSSPVLKGVILGARESLPEELYNAFIKTSTSHIFAISGLHVGILVFWTYYAFRFIIKRFGVINKAFVYVPAIPVIILYACMIGFYTSIMRASILLIFVVMAVIINRDIDLLNILAIAALFILSLFPGSLFEIGFQLSFGTVASIAYFMLYWNSSRKDKWYSKSLHYTAQIIAVSWSAQIGAALIIAYHFQNISLVSPIVNPIVVFLVSLIVPLGFISCIIGLIYLPLAFLFGYINHYLLISPMISIVSYFSNFWWSVVRSPGFSLWNILAFLVLFVFIINIPGLLRQRKQKLIIAGAFTTAILIWSIALSYEGRLLKATYLDVDQGDSIFVELPGGRNILIDGGAYKERFDAGKRVIIPFLQKKGVNRINLAVLTHPHNDHVGGFIYTLENIKIDEVITGSYGISTPTFDILKERFHEKGIKYRDAELGNIYKDDKLCIEVLMCGAGRFLGSKNEDICMDNNSVVFKITYKDVSFLFPGDIRQDSERYLINSQKNIGTTVLKIPHHGSSNSSNEEFLRAVNPIIGVFSVGRNNFDHPDPDVIKRYKQLKIKTYRTDLDGAVTITTDGKRGWIKTMCR